MQWHRLSLEKTKSKNGKELKKLTMVYMYIGTNELLDYFKPKLQHFVHHNYQTRWQDKNSRKCMKEFPADVILPIVDFAENYTFQYKMKFNPCIGVVFKLLFLSILPFVITLTLMMQDLC